MSNNTTFQFLERSTCHGFYTITGKYQEQSAILPVSVNMTVLRIVMIVRIPESGNRKSPRFLRFLAQVGTKLEFTTRSVLQ